jgi:hypothetical protein
VRRSWRTYLGIICGALFWIGIAFVVVPRLGDPMSFNSPSNPSVPPEAVQSGDQSPARAFRGNVYHIIFDSYQSEAYPYFLAKTPELSHLPLTYFPNFRSSRPKTNLSLAELFMGNFYSSDMPIERWQSAAFQSGMMDYLANGGVQLHLYPYYPEYCYRGAATTCETIEDVKKGLLGEGRSRQTAFDLWFLKLIPGSLKRELNARFAPKGEEASKDDSLDDDSFSDWDYGFSIFNAIAPSQMPGDYDKPYFSVQQFMRLLDEEDSRPATGQYVFSHLILPHGAFVLDGECNYVGRIAQTGQEGYFQQVQCAHKLMSLLVKKLESLGRLDDSLIIFQADHGFYWHPADLGVLSEYHPLDASVPRVDPDEDDSSTWPSEMIETRSSALLLIKFPGQSTASRSDKPVQMIDIAPTILRDFGVGSDSMRGIPIQDMPESPARDRFFFASSGRAVSASSFSGQFSTYRYVDGRWKFEGDVATFTDADQLFIIRLAQ